ncbi:MAG: PEGA domain-containing protein [Polyangiaceae bacterium]|nr:PEGA domain-containing protein [Polyangiaceae bacterium]MCL4750271.1 PEGA domain-containing protein [Myxococcales bacterium]
MADLNSSPSNEKPSLDVLFPDLKKSDTALPAPRFMAPATAAASLLKGAPPSARVVPPPPSLRKPPPSVKPPPPSARGAHVAPPEELDVEELLATSPEASPAPLEPIRPVDDDYVDEGPTVAMQSPMLAPVTSRPALSAPRPALPTPPPSRRAAPPPSAAKLPPLPSAPSSGKHSAPVAAKPSTPSATKLPPVPLPPPSLRNVAPPSKPMEMESAPALPPVYTDEEEQPVVHAPVSSRASRASAAASLAAGSGPVRAYVPPSAPPPASRPVAPQETVPASRAHSLMPTAASVPPPAVAPAKKSRAGLWAVAAVASLGVFGALGFAAVKGSSALGLGSAGTGSVAVTASGPGGAKIDGLRVFVDGVVKCESAPCRLTNLGAGTHFVSADAPGFAATAARAVAVERGAEAALHIDLVPANAASAPAPEQKAEAKATSLDDLAPVQAAAPAPASESRARAPEKKDAKKPEATKAEAKLDAKKAIAEEATGGGTLNINSIPVASVVLDGRPVGSTPLVGLKVSAGPHSVVFIHPEHGRKASGTTVKAGGTATVAVRF